MSPKQIINSIEIRFWQMIIPVIRRSDVVRKTFLVGYKGVQKYRVVSFGYQLIVCLLISVVVGLTIGYLIRVI